MVFMIMRTRRIRWRGSSNRSEFVKKHWFLRTGGVMTDRAMRRFVVAQVILWFAFTFLLTLLSIAIADHVGTPEIVRWIASPGYVLGIRLAWGMGFWDQLGSFMLIALLVNLSYYGLAIFLLLRRINWPKLPRNPRHHFWMEP